MPHGTLGLSLIDGVGNEFEQALNSGIEAMEMQGNGIYKVVSVDHKLM
jgi:hypothetical protein